jgi:hypothetical protein
LGNPKFCFSQARVQAVADGESGLIYVAYVCVVMQEAQRCWNDVADLCIGDIVWCEPAARL